MSRHHTQLTDDGQTSVPERQAGEYTFEDIHKAIFPEPPEPHTLEEFKEAIGRYMREKHGRR